MSLIQKTFLIMITVGLAVFFCLNQLLHTLLMDSFIRLEEQAVYTDIQRARDALRQEIDSLNAITKDWASFDDTYAFMQNGDPEYVQANLPPSILESLDLFAILYIDNNNQIVLSRKAGSDPLNPPSTLKTYLNSSDLSQSARLNETSGVLLLPEGPIIFSACPILTSNRTGPAQGVLLMVRTLDEMNVTRLNNLTKLSFDFSTIASNPPAVTGEVWYQRFNDQVIHGLTVINNWQGQPALIMELSQPRTIYQNGLATMDYFTKAIGLIILLFSLLIWLLLRRLVIRPIEDLGWNVHSVGQQGSFSGRVPYQGHDEVAALGMEINHMLAELEDTHKQVAEGRTQYQELFDSALSANYVSTPEGKLMLCNRVFLQLMGYASMEEALSTDTHELYEDNAARQEFLNEVKQKHTLENRETALVTRDGKQLTVLENVVGIFNEANDLVQIRGFMIDITARKQSEEAIIYLSYHDQLTGLYNRCYMEQMLPALDTVENLPLSAIVIDVNGLKLVNDALGHAQGDFLLKSCAENIMAACRPDDLICRWGGDEFLVLMPKTSFNTANMVCQRIKRDSGHITIQGIKTSASIGAVTKEDPSQHLSEILKEAEERMYREKLLERTSNRHSIILSLEKSLYEKTPESREHALRLQNNMVMLGQSLDLPEHELDELRLLAALHDIGKVAIPENILHKESALTPEEHEILKKHSEIGYRIAKSIPEMNTVAEAILCHHERWDGNGYPLGLAGEDIPLPARIIAIVNTYDVFFYGRRYQEKCSFEVVVSELRRRAGMDFDPFLVDVFVSCLHQHSAVI